MEISDEKERDSLKQGLELIYSKHLATPPPSMLFHYTDTRGLLGLFTSQNLWATHTSYLNDTTEISHTYTLVEEIYNDLIARAKPDEKSAYDHQLWVYRDFLHRISYKTTRAKLKPDFYAACFCKDDDLLSQWRGYGNSGAGYAIGFDTKRLSRPDHSVLLRRVIYSSEEQKQFLNEILKLIISSLKRMTDGMNVSSAEHIIESYALIFEQEVTKYAPFFKNSTFHEECEWRLIYSPNEKDSSNKIKYRSSDFGIVPYAELNFVDSDDDKYKKTLPIVSVRIGPTAQPELARKALEMAADSKYPYLNITSSDVPLR